MNATGRLCLSASSHSLTGHGLDIWRVEQFNLVMIPKQEFGTFNDGDVYLILNRVDDQQGAIAHVEEVCRTARRLLRV